MVQRPTFLSLLWPALTGILAILLALAPIKGAAAGLEGPHWLLIFLGFWASRRYWTTPPLLVFALGLAYDLLRDGPIGAELFALLVTIEATRILAERKPPFGFWTEWLRFALAVLFFELVVALLMAITYAPTPPALLIGERMLWAVLLYPPVAFALQRLSGARIGEGRFTHLTF